MDDPKPLTIVGSKTQWHADGDRQSLGICCGIMNCAPSWFYITVEPLGRYEESEIYKRVRQLLKRNELSHENDGETFTPEQLF